RPRRPRALPDELVGLARLPSGIRGVVPHVGQTARDRAPCARADARRGGLRRHAPCLAHLSHRGVAGAPAPPRRSPVTRLRNVNRFTYTYARDGTYESPS